MHKRDWKNIYCKVIQINWARESESVGKNTILKSDLEGGFWKKDLQREVVKVNWVKREWEKEIGRKILKRKLTKKQLGKGYCTVSGMWDWEKREYGTRIGKERLVPVRAR